MHLTTITRLPVFRLGVLGFLCNLSIAFSSAFAQPSYDEPAWHEYAKGVFSFETEYRNSIVLVGDSGVLIMDTYNPAHAQALKREIKQRFNLPVQYVVYSHAHADHLRGANIFSDTAMFILGSMASIVEDEPMPENRIELSGNTDKFGMSRAKVFYRTSAEGQKLWHTAAAKGVEIMKAAGAREAWHGPQGAQHIMGGTVLGQDPSKSVLDAHARCHDVANLYVGGPSVFPTSSCINSTFTAHAVAMKSARHIVENWK